MGDWRHSTLRNTRVAVGTEAFTIDREGVLSPTPQSPDVIAILEQVPCFEPLPAGPTAGPNTDSDDETGAAEAAPEDGAEVVPLKPKKTRTAKKKRAAGRRK